MRRLPILGLLALVAAFAEAALAGGQVVDLGPPAILQTSDAAVPPPPAPPCRSRPNRNRARRWPFPRWDRRRLRRPK